MTTLLIKRRKVTGLVAAGILLLGINSGRASLLTNSDGGVYDQNGTKYTQAVRATPTPSPSATPIPTATPVSTATPPPSTPVPSVTPPPATPAPSAPSTAAFPGLGTAGKYAVLSLTGTFQNQSGTTINGDLGIGPYSFVTNQSTSVVKGGFYYDPSTTRLSGSPSATGGTYTQSMLQPALDAWNASNYYKNYATQSNVFSSISAATTIVGHTGFNVFSLSGGISLNNASLTLSGSSSDYFVFNIYGGLSMTGTSSIKLTGGLTSSNVLFNFIGAGSALTTQLGSTVRGTILSIGRSISFDGVFIGEIIGGGSGQTFTLLSGTTVGRLAGPAVAPSVPDQGSAVWLSLISLIVISAVERFLRAKPQLRRT